MKHASRESLNAVLNLLNDLARVPELKEKSFGVFYYKNRAFLHFHEHGQSLCADIRLTEPDFVRMDVSAQPEQEKLLTAVKQRVAKWTFIVIILPVMAMFFI